MAWRRASQHGRSMPRREEPAGRLCQWVCCALQPCRCADTATTALSGKPDASDVPSLVAKAMAGLQRPVVRLQCTQTDLRCDACRVAVLGCWFVHHRVAGHAWSKCRWPSLKECASTVAPSPMATSSPTSSRSQSLTSSVSMNALAPISAPCAVGFRHPHAERAHMSRARVAPQGEQRRQATRGPPMQTNIIRECALEFAAVPKP